MKVCTGIPLASISPAYPVYPSPAVFNYVFDKCNFSIISNLFYYNKPYALGTHNGKCANKMHRNN